MPAITVCNHNAFVRSRVEQHLTPAARAAFNESLLWRLGYDPDSIDFSTLPDTSFWHLFGELSPSVNETFVECTFALAFIDCDEYVRRMYFSEVSCFTFHAYAYTSQHGHLQALAPGKNAGFAMVLDAMPHENFVPSQAGIGFDVYIHDQSVFPHTDGHHFAIGPGQQVNVAIEQEKTVRLSRPYFEDDCMSAADVIRNEVRLEQADINNSYVIPYSQEYCEYECDFRFVFGGCGCAGGESGHCSSFRRTVECYNERYRDTLAPGNCHCQPTCEQTHYSLQISSGQYPSNLDVMVASRRNWTVQSEADMRSRLVYLDVYFKSLTVEVTRYVPALTLTDLFSTIGGLLGLFAGASVMTVIEFVDMGLVCLFTLVKKRLRKGSEVNDSRLATESVKNKR